MTVGRKKTASFRNLRVDPYQPKEWLPGYGDEESVDVSGFTDTRYVVTFECRRGLRRRWQKVTGYAR